MTALKIESGSRPNCVFPIATPGVATPLSRGHIFII